MSLSSRTSFPRQLTAHPYILARTNRSLHVNILPKFPENRAIWPSKRYFTSLFGIHESTVFRERPTVLQEPNHGIPGTRLRYFRNECTVL